MPGAIPIAPARDLSLAGFVVLVQRNLSVLNAFIGVARLESRTGMAHLLEGDPSEVGFVGRSISSGWSTAEPEL